MQEKLERSRKKAKLAAKTKLSFGGDDEEEGDAEVQTVSGVFPCLRHSTWDCPHAVCVYASSLMTLIVCRIRRFTCATLRELGCR